MFLVALVRSRRSKNPNTENTKEAFFNDRFNVMFKYLSRSIWQITDMDAHEHERISTFTLRHKLK